MPTCWSAPRSARAMNGSPATCSEKRVQRAQRTQRSRSSSTCAEMLIGLGKVRLTPPPSAKRLSPRPLLIAWFCRGHSPPLSQTGQSSGWLISRNSMTPCWALSATSLVAWVLTTMPSATGSVQEACGVGDVDEALAARADRVEQRVVAEPRDLYADLLGGADHEGVLGDAHLHAVDGQRDEVGVDLLGRLVGRGHASAPTGEKAVEAAGSNGQPPWGRCARYSSLKCLTELEIGLVAPSPRAQKE